MSDLNKLTIAEARDALKKGDVTSVELTQACLTAIDGADALGAFVHKTPEIALERAATADERIKSGDAPAMCGIPVGIKDLFCTKGVASQAASNILEGFKPEYESTVSGKLADAGAVMLGKLNMDEFAMGSSNETSAYGNAVNPWKVDDRNLTPGGSSGGSASAVAADLCLAATGTDTGGSIRQPAALTGTVGIKPTYGRCSRWGIIAFASSLDQAGPMTKTVRDAAIMLEAMSGHDEKDSTSADLAVPNFEAMLTGDIRGKVIGIPREYRVDGMSDEIEALWQTGRKMLEAVGGLLRRLLQPRPPCARADQARLRRGVRARSGCDPDASDPRRGLWSWVHGGCRPGRDVSSGRVHRDREPRRSAGYLGACRARQAGTAARTATHRQTLGRGRSAEYRLCAGTGRGFCFQAGKMVVERRDVSP